MPISCHFCPPHPPQKMLSWQPWPWSTKKEEDLVRASLLILFSLLPFPCQHIFFKFFCEFRDASLLCRRSLFSPLPPRRSLNLTNSFPSSTSGKFGKSLYFLSERGGKRKSLKEGEGERKTSLARSPGAWHSLNKKKAEDAILHLAAPGHTWSRLSTPGRIWSHLALTTWCFKKVPLTWILFSLFKSWLWHQQEQLTY